MRPPRTSLAETRPLTIAILAIGGQGGGVLADWMVGLAESQGWWAQATSVPGVAQRTGATLYYVEVLPGGGPRPVLSLAPLPGDVDLVVSAELMEAGRAIQRGLVTPDRTVLVTSTHRAYAIDERGAAGDGLADDAVVVKAAEEAARRLVAFDAAAVAERAGSVISSALFGAVAGAGVLPFGREAYEAAIRAGGVGVEPSLQAFGAAYELCQGDAADPLAARADGPADSPALAAARSLPALLAARVVVDFPDEAQPMLTAGCLRLLDYQDLAYASDYLDRLQGFAGLDRATGGASRGYELTVELARYLARAMAYDDVVRVADLKTRAPRFARVRAEVGAADGQIVHTTEYMHPRREEVLATLPAALGAWLERREAFGRWLDRILKGRRVRTTSLTGFLQLYILGGLRPWRRSLLRHRREQAHWEAWLAQVSDALSCDYDLALEVARCRRLVRGYSDTFGRGRSKFDQLMSIAQRLRSRDDGAAWLRRLREIALKDEGQADLDGAIRTVESLG